MDEIELQQTTLRKTEEDMHKKNFLKSCESVRRSDTDATFPQKQKKQKKKQAR